MKAFQEVHKKISEWKLGTPLGGGGGGGIHVTLEKGGLLRGVVCLLLGMQYITFRFKKIEIKIKEF